MATLSTTLDIHQPDASFTPDQLHVIAVVHNPLRFRSRDVLFQQFVQHMQAAGVTLHVVEAAFGERHHRHSDLGAHTHTLFQHSNEIWMKEAMINAGFSRLPDDWKYAAWIDGDVHFARPDWATETIHQLQHYRVVQMFQTAADLGPTGEIVDVHNSFGWSYAAGLPKWVHGNAPEAAVHDGLDYYFYDDSESLGGTRPAGKFWHPGYAWAIRRKAFDDLGGLIDWSGLGSADHMMALAMIGEVEKSIPGNLHPNYLRHARLWQELAAEHIRGDMGFVPGTITHSWHGRKRERFYVPRWEILRKHAYDPERDIRRDHQRMVHFTRPGERLRDDMRTYFRSRNEDGVEL